MIETVISTLLWKVAGLLLSCAPFTGVPGGSHPWVAKTRTDRLGSNPTNTARSSRQSVQPCSEWQIPVRAPLRHTHNMFVFPSASHSQDNSPEGDTSIILPSLPFSHPVLGQHHPGDSLTFLFAGLALGDVFWFWECEEHRIRGGKSSQQRYSGNSSPWDTEGCSTGFLVLPAGFYWQQSQDHTWAQHPLQHSPGVTCPFPFTNTINTAI